MGFREPFAAYNAASNHEAHIVCGFLIDAGIEAMVVEDVSNIGIGYLGFLSEIFKPQVWIDRADIARATLVLDVSLSMAWRSSPALLTKRVFAEQLTAAMALLLLRQRDAVGLIRFDDAVRTSVPPRARTTQWRRLIAALAQTSDPRRIGVESAVAAQD